MKIICVIASGKFAFLSVEEDELYLVPSGDFKAFARELFMSDYDMGDGGHVFRTC